MDYHKIRASLETINHIVADEIMALSNGRHHEDWIEGEEVDLLSKWRHDLVMLIVNMPEEPKD